MKPCRVLLLLLVGIPATAFAQRDAPVWECFLPSITVTHAPGSRLSLEMVFKKETGPVEHVEHQMYLLGYLTEDEPEILKISSDPTLLDKRKPDKDPLFLDVLIEKGLVTEIDTQLGKRQDFASQDVSGKYADGSDAGRAKEQFLKLNTFPFQFTLQKAELFDAIGRLKHFDKDKIGSFGYFASRFRLMVFVPVNDSKYATKVADSVRGQNDFAHFGDKVNGGGKGMSQSTAILYFRPLPYEFQFRKVDGGEPLLYIN